jgi:hypothetical protein
MSPRVAIVHYHLRPGGVTRVIEAGVRALRAAGADPAVITGSAAPADFPAPAREVSGLNYDAVGPGAEPLAHRIEAAERDLFGGAADVLWMHNPTLGKNPSLTGAVRHWAAQGRRMILHLHDFAEDGRPALYAALAGAQPAPGRWLYPAGPHLRYAVLNSRDRDVLLRAGADPASVSLLPNAVDAPAESAPPEAAEPGRLLNPVRAIRRKNIGELLLRAAQEPRRRWALTLPPTQPADLPAYRRWRALAERLNLAVEFETGAPPQGEPLARALARAEAVYTTSIAEGFGLGFLEPWAAHRSVCGRDLPELTTGLREAGLTLDGLYSAWPVPWRVLDGDAFRRRFVAAFARSRQRYGRADADNIAGRAWDALAANETVDFGALDEPAQTEVLLHADRLAPPPPANAAAPDVIARNAACVRTAFGADAYARGVQALLDAVFRTDPAPVPALDGDAVLDFFLDPARFRMLRT